MTLGSEPLRIAVVGVGYWGPNLVRTFDALDGCSVAAVCDKQPARLEFIHERFPHILLTTSYDDLLKDESVVAVAIATPVSTHAALASRALRAGKHVFVEKPLATRSADALALVEDAERARRVLAVGHVFVAHPAISRLHEEIRAGTLGRLCYVQSTRINLGPPGSEVDVVWDLAVHDVSILLSLVGEEPVEVATTGGRYVHPSLNDVAFLTMRFSNELLAVSHVSWLSAIRVRRFFVAGSLGSATFDDLAATGKLVLSDVGRDTRRQGGTTSNLELRYGPGQVVVPDLPTTPPLTVECERFLRSLRGDGTPIADGRAGLAVVRVLEAAELSLANGVPIRTRASASDVT